MACWCATPSAGGFSLHAGVAAQAYQRDRLERLCRYVTRPAVAEPRLSLTAGGRIRYALKSPWRDGTTHVVFEPPDIIARIAALVPRPRVNLTRYHGVFAPNSRWRSRITPGGRMRRRYAAGASSKAGKFQLRTAPFWGQAQQPHQVNNRNNRLRVLGRSTN